MTSIEEIKEILKELTLAQKETDKQIKAVNEQLGGIGNSNGDHAEEFFFNALKSKMKLGKVKFDQISRNLKYRKNRVEDEFDIVVFNGKNIGLIETKYKVRKQDLDNLINKKVKSFKIMYPEYENSTFYLGLAGFSFEDAALEKNIEKNGVAVLKQKGNHVEMHDKNLIAF